MDGVFWLRLNTAGVVEAGVVAKALGASPNLEKLLKAGEAVAMLDAAPKGEGMLGFGVS